MIANIFPPDTESGSLRARFFYVEPRPGPPPPA